MRNKHVVIATVITASLSLMTNCQPVPQPAQQAEPAAEVAAQPLSSDPLIAGFQQSTVASVSDAVDQVTGRRGYMSHDMRPLIGKAFPRRSRDRREVRLV